MAIPGRLDVASDVGCILCAAPATLNQRRAAVLRSRRILGSSGTVFYTYCGVPRVSRALQSWKVEYVREDGRSGAASSPWEVLVSDFGAGPYT